MSEQNNEQRSQAAGTDTVDRGNSNAKLEQLEAYREDATGEALSTNTGTRIADNQNTLKAGERGPSLLEDFIMREKITHFDHERIPERIRDKLLYPKPIEIRPVTQHDPYDPQPDEPVKYLWFRADGKLPDVPALHKYLLAYASDFGFLTTSMQPHAVSVWQKTMQVASLDHALWFHRDLRADEWLLYAIDSPWAGNARGFVRGSIFNRDGQLVASSTQEGLIRRREDWA